MSRSEKVERVLIADDLDGARELQCPQLIDSEGVQMNATQFPAASFGHGLRDVRA
ncbi:MAG TPA: hypothetical protein VMF32_15950 [Xanthobacteraceae bacterium]|nr:hypothetical protein [Xanthobacteraceae bacterium]